MEDLSVMTDEALAMSYANGNNRAFDELLSRNQSKLFSYILFVVRNREVADDVFQETFVKVITRLQQGRYSPSGKFGAWLVREESLLSLDIESKYVNTQVLRDVRKMMNLLPASQREVVYMRFYQQLSFKEIADMTNVSINTSLGRMRYAILNLRRMAKEHHITLQLT